MPEATLMYARRKSKCHECGKTIYVGDAITPNRDKWNHYECHKKHTKKVNKNKQKNQKKVSRQLVLGDKKYKLTLEEI